MVSSASVAPQNDVVSTIAKDPARKPRKKALLIGSNYIYTAHCHKQEAGNPSPEGANQTYSSLDSPCKDVDRWKNLLIKCFHFSEENIRVLVDEEADCRRGSSQPHPGDTNGVSGNMHQHDPRLRPKRANIKRELRELIKDSIHGDQLFFFFAGHVGQVDCEENTEEDGQDEALVPADALDKSNWLKDNELKKILVDDLTPGVQLMCIIDACHSATLFDLPHGRCNSLKVTPSSIQRTLVSGFASPTRRASLQDVSHSTTSTGPRRSATLGEIFADNRQKTVNDKEDTKDTSRDRDLTLRQASSTGGTTIHEASPLCRAEEEFVQRFLPHRQGSSASDIMLCESPTQIVSSQAGLAETCGEGCQIDPHFKGPIVVTLSACQDDQEAWEHKLDGGCLTKVLVPFLEENANRTYQEIMERLRDALDGIVHLEHEKFRNRSPERSRKRRGRYHGPAYQDPQLCSSTPLDLGQPL